MLKYKYLYKIYHDLMVAYLTNASLATVTGREGYASWGFYNIFLTPAHD